MNIDKSLLPIKAHFALFCAGLSAIFPFLFVLARQLGVPEKTQGMLMASLLVVTIFTRSLLASLADIFVKWRKFIFLAILATMTMSFTSLYFLPSMSPNPYPIFQGQINIAKEKENPNTSTLTKAILISEETETTNVNNKFEIERKTDFVNLPNGANTTFKCKGDESQGDCGSVEQRWTFWLYSFVLFLCVNFFLTANSISNATCIDNIGPTGNYGRQRMMGTLFWGITAPIAGLLVDKYSEKLFQPDFLPSFVILFSLGCIDLLLCAFVLRVPRIEGTGSLWRNVGGVIRQPRVLTLLLFILMGGIFNGTTHYYILLYIDDVAEGAGLENQLKMIQGLTFTFQCLGEFPALLGSNWIIKKIGAQWTIGVSMMFFSLRLLSHFFISALGLAGTAVGVWSCVILELLNGPSFGLLLPSYVIYAGTIAPKGTSATMQSLTNIVFESVGYGLAGLIGGALYTGYGGATMFGCIGCLAVLTTILFFVIHCCILRQPEGVTEDVNLQSSVGAEDLNTEF